MALFTQPDQPAEGTIVVIMQRLHENDFVGQLPHPERDTDTERLVIRERESDPPAQD